jgi:hypothetical protein
MPFHLRREITVETPIDEVFDFFSDAGNLEKLTPPELRFQILTPLGAKENKAPHPRPTTRFRSTTPRGGEALPPYGSPAVGHQFITRRAARGHKRLFRGNGIHPIGDVSGCFDGDRASFQLKQPSFASILLRCWESPSEVAMRSAIRDGL